MNHETVAWLLFAERQRELAELERKQALRRSLEEAPEHPRPERPRGIRRSIGLRLIRLGADLANLSAGELAGSAD